MAALPTIALCAGGGGLERGVARALAPLVEVRPVLYVEIEAFAAAYLVAEMEAGRLARAPVWGPISWVAPPVLAALRGLARRYPVAVTAGIPCQPWSTAGKRQGTADERWIWDDIARIIREVGPGLVVLECVPGLALGGLEHVLGTMADAGLDAAWDLYSAAEAGAPHLRRRLFVVAVSDAFRESLRAQQGRLEPGRAGEAEPGHLGANVGDPNGFGLHGTGRPRGPRPTAGRPSVADRCRPGLEERGRVGRDGGAQRKATERGGGEVADRDGGRQPIERGPSRDGGPLGGDPPRHEPDGCGKAMADGHRSGRSEGISDDATRQPDPGWCLPEFPPAPDDWRGWLHVLDAGRPDLLPRALANGAQPAVPALDDGPPAAGGLALVDANRADALRLGGNAVVPAQAELAVRELMGVLV